ncbi:hypothetical protein K437DRAFT_191589 [Tilletiaria anomala UBC 951]|uniref:Uncharacterized protein n=1 Tax=Tilletiaria anomala (strain ATCC 24038 / CBS 436.72 / UBC 951) TaxID=1037660 RepID=A0A066VN07_TILAU|nr:uncharacterized protein K437DRAFT_191589 [Tilletiaria anomala UBC 951]KDN40159.1 hypothetical protein K437DRAFT_191589 [Tilletiaria anomala UBC 951]
MLCSRLHCTASRFLQNPLAGTEWTVVAGHSNMKSVKVCGHSRHMERSSALLLLTTATCCLLLLPLLLVGWLVLVLVGFAPKYYTYSGHTHQHHTHTLSFDTPA